jgi:DNA-binding response OmpR family regulator
MSKVLIVDDEKNFVHNAIDYFKLSGWEAVGALNAEDALKVIDASFDAVLLDWSMPGMTGGQLLKILRKREDLARMAIVIFTAYGTVESAVDAVKAGADDYLQKDHALPTIEQKLSEVVAKRRAAAGWEHSKIRIFLCHASQDKPTVRRLHARLKRDGYLPWLDEEQLLGGQDWDLEIRRAVGKSDVVIVCLSKTSVGKAGYLQKEIKHALDVADEQPQDAIFIVPLKLSACDVPERLRRWQWIDMQQRDGYQQLLRSLRRRAAEIQRNGSETSN